MSDIDDKLAKILDILRETQAAEKANRQVLIHVLARLSVMTSRPHEFIEDVTESAIEDFKETRKLVKPDDYETLNDIDSWLRQAEAFSKQIRLLMEPAKPRRAVQ